MNRVRAALGPLTGTSPASAGKTQRSKILIAEDDPSTRKILQATLTRWGHDTVACPDGREALQVLQQPDGPVMAVLDWMMPELEGVEVCRELRKTPQGSLVYVLMLTGKDRTEEVIEALEAGADDYLVKPYDPDELKKRVLEGLRKLGLKPGTPEGSVSFQDHGELEHGVLKTESILVLLKQEIVRCNNEKSHSGVAIVEVDGFDEIVKRFGSVAGSTVSGETLKILRRSVGGLDRLGRLTSEKFLLIARDRDREKMLRFADDLRSAVAAAQIGFRKERIPVTISMGLTSLESGLDKVGVEVVISVAEAALSRAKKPRPGWGAV